MKAAGIRRIDVAYAARCSEQAVGRVLLNKSKSERIIAIIKQLVAERSSVPATR